MKQYSLSELDEAAVQRLCKRPAIDLKDIFRQVEPILDAVRNEGDDAVRRYTLQFDNKLPESSCIDPKESEPDLEPEIEKALDKAISNVEKFHRSQATPALQVETTPGVVCRKETRPIEKVGLYIPGGSAPLPSTAIMLGVPASAAGCETIVMATPPDSRGQVPDSVLYVARRIGAEKVLLAGGAQAIAALALGTESVPKVDKIFGPGNQYVTAAKMMLQNSDAMVAIDLPAGPSELLVIAAEESRPEWVAADLLSQAEHGPDSQVVLVAIEGFDLDRFRITLKNQLEGLPRADIARNALENSLILTARSPEEAVDFSNRYAPEHLSIQLDDADSLSESIRHTGSVFLGHHTPESLGDYASGTNHTLPTYSYARMYSGVGLSSFQKCITFQSATKEGLLALGPAVETLAGLEGLEAHRRAVSIRRNPEGSHEN